MQREPIEIVYQYKTWKANIDKCQKYLVFSNDTPESYRYLLFHFCRIGDVQIIKKLIEIGADINVGLIQGGRDFGASTKNTCLIVSATMGHLELVELLIKNNANILAKDEHGESALDYAKQYKYTKIIELLNSKGAIE